MRTLRLPRPVIGDLEVLAIAVYYNWFILFFLKIHFNDIKDE